jgi:hypothetical protein
MKLRVLLVVILASFFTPLPAHATPGWCFENVDGQQVCGATFEESAAQTIADMNVRSERNFIRWAAEAAAAEAALQAEWRRQAADQAAREAEGLRISQENAAKNKAEEAARLAAEELQKNPPSTPQPSNSPEDPHMLVTPEIPQLPYQVVIDCAIPQNYEHVNCGGPRPAPVVTPQPEAPRVEIPRNESSRAESQVPVVIAIQKEESVTAIVDVMEKPKDLEEEKILATPKVAGAVVDKPIVQSAPKSITPAPKVAISAPTTKKVVSSSVPVKKAPQITKISCYKGKILKVISGTNPTCPTGYSQK